ncbi:glycosyltransferase family 2 protein [Elizabethkingia meningoseptica]|uniref:glycosyltransferase family 2 protein n=1 Tax=Elizabethkingia meningoseptica TaxID=238 RepID=UPI00084218CD|nr:glycosyltransferase [Elizabethkingia meningoseptica]ODM54954.1 glycosyl transferase [Elizabethkingia meningoseptica]OHT30161.1 glycosyl transferase [Elizabethkingia meningoseptica]OPC11833.1 glycosyl transferase [Elizabethkingia meningoseptica]
MNNFPKVSIVTITYGHQNQIVEAMESIIHQQYSGDIEFIIANDCSPDDTDEIINKYLESHIIPDNIEVKYVRHSINIGMMPNFFYGLKQASGKYIALCEGDDFWTEPEKLQKQVLFLENNPEFCITFTNVNVVYEDGLENKVSTLVPIKESREYSGVEILKTWSAHTSTFVFRNNAGLINNFEKFYNKYRFSYGDTPLFLYLLEFGKAYGFTDYTSSYRRHLGGTLSQKEAIKDGLKYITYLESINKAFNNKNYDKINNNRISAVYLSLLRNKEVKLSDSVKYLFKCIYYDPLLFFKIIKEKLKSKS